VTMSPDEKVERLKALVGRLRAARQYTDSHRGQHAAVSHPVTRLWCEPEFYALLERLAERELRELAVKALHEAWQKGEVED